MLKLGSTEINKLYLGSTEIKKAYLGSTLIFDSAVVDPIPIGNLVSYYNFNNNVNDSKGSNDGTPTDITYVVGKSGNAASFNGTSSYVDFGLPIVSTFNNNAAFSISMFMYSEEFTGFLAATEGDTGTRGFQFKLGGSEIDFLFISGGLVIFEGTTLYKNKWTHITVTYDGAGDFKMYIDGIDIGATKKSGASPNIGTITNPLRLGVDGRGLDTFFTGKIDGMGVWDKALTQTEITDIYDKQNAGNEIL